jgi:hypothetical protein
MYLAGSTQLSTVYYCVVTLKVVSQNSSTKYSDAGSNCRSAVHAVMIKLRSFLKLQNYNEVVRNIGSRNQVVIDT